MLERSIEECYAFTEEFWLARTGRLSSKPDGYDFNPFSANNDSQLLYSPLLMAIHWQGFFYSYQ
jgi:hypothetical protein